MKLGPLDRDALERAMALARRDPMRAAQLDDKLRGESWRAVAEFASYHVQCRALNLRPWQSPPCCLAEGDHDDDADAGGRQLLKRMLAAGLSRFEPDPMGALK